MLGAAPVQATGIEGGTVLTQATVRGRTLVQMFRTPQGLRRHDRSRCAQLQLASAPVAKALVQ